MNWASRLDKFTVKFVKGSKTRTTNEPEFSQDDLSSEMLCLMQKRNMKTQS